MQHASLCMGCMIDRGVNLRCSNCGWVEGTSQSLPQHLSPRTMLNNRYILGRVLGHGGFGVTYLAWDTKVDIRIAIKEYLPQDLATRVSGKSEVKAFSTGELQDHYQYGLQRFLDEGRTLAQFADHPGIVAFKDFFEENGTAYLVMQYLDGITFKQFLRIHGGRIPVDQAVEILMPVMDALTEVHNVGLLHRDVSPDNIQICKNGQVKIMDFGAARYSINEHSHSLSIMLKMGYTPFEQYSSRGKQGPWTDLYAIAATLYHAIFGQTPPDALDRLYNESLDFPDELHPDLQQLLTKALAVKSENRYQSIKEFQDILVQIFTNNEGNIKNTNIDIAVSPMSLDDEDTKSGQQSTFKSENTIAANDSQTFIGPNDIHIERQSLLNKYRKIVIIGLIALLMVVSAVLTILNSQNKSTPKTVEKNHTNQATQKKQEPIKNDSVIQQVPATPPISAKNTSDLKNQTGSKPVTTTPANKVNTTPSTIPAGTKPFTPVSPVGNQGGWYEGDIKNGLPNGYGTYHNKDGTTMVGRWENGTYIGL